ncbi:MAG: transposase [Candidatus Beckwithbacteria bacterium]|nr:transposase [Candidatus Beckwithbacteria bacterium]
MPAKNIIKTYLENAYYHLYNRGVNKQIIFKNQQDYGVFLGYLKQYLSPKDKNSCLRNITIHNKVYKILTPPCNNYYQEIKLLAYCLMPNHFHLLVKQKSERGIESFMKSLGTRYTMYFNKRHQRIGPLFQGRYKAVMVDNENQLLHLSRYIHLNSLSRNPTQPSSYSDYLGLNHTVWIHPQEILAYFKTAHKINLNDVNSYQNFVEDYAKPSETFLENLALDS